MFSVRSWIATNSFNLLRVTNEKRIIRIYLTRLTKIKYRESLRSSYFVVAKAKTSPREDRAWHPTTHRLIYCLVPAQNSSLEDPSYQEGTTRPVPRPDPDNLLHSQLTGNHGQRHSTRPDRLNPGRQRRREEAGRNRPEKREHTPRDPILGPRSHTDSNHDRRRTILDSQMRC